jgi:deoxyribodipyrimidine photolyase-related protein
MKAAIILGNQLLEHHPSLLDPTVEMIIMIEAQDMCRKHLYHTHKLILLLSGMRHYRRHVEKNGKKIVYRTIGETSRFVEELEAIITNEHVSTLVWMKSSDTTPNSVLSKLAKQKGILYELYPNDMFMTPEAELRDWFDRQKSPLMEHFYRWQRQRTGILLQDGAPVGGRWNFDNENRRALPKNGVIVPSLPLVKPDGITKAVIEDIHALFPDHPGKPDQFWLPVTHADATEWLDVFIETRFSQFGPYEDAMKDGQPFLFHSVLSPLLNCGLLSVRQVIDVALNAYLSGKAPIASVEGFIRQIIGWREYMYGKYLSEPALITENYFGFTKQLEDWWYTDEAFTKDLPTPVQGALRTVHAYGYNHHIERLMILGNWFLLNEYDPKSVYDWFLSMYVDAYQWVMVPNVMGMSQYADGGKTATKPYISGGNYLQKMGRWWPNATLAKESQFTVLYWRFLQNNYEKLQSNFRMSLALKQALQRIDRPSD